MWITQSFINIGASQLIIERHIKLKRGQIVVINETGAIRDDRTDLEADVVVCAPG
ncbi:MAG: hypothetical protein AAF409_14610 [Pseudomonadota bacterium]